MESTRSVLKKTKKKSKIELNSIRFGVEYRKYAPNYRIYFPV